MAFDKLNTFLELLRPQEHNAVKCATKIEQVGEVEMGNLPGILPNWVFVVEKKGQSCCKRTPVQSCMYGPFSSKKKIAAREFRVWSPTTLLGLALSSLTTVDRTGNGAFC